MKNIFILFTICSIAFISCNGDPEQKCWGQIPKIDLIHFDSLDLQSMKLFQYNKCCQFDSLISIDSVGLSYHFANGVPDTFTISKPKGPSSGGSILDFQYNIKIKMRNNVEINISNLIQSTKICRVPHGQMGVFCPCDVIGFDITGINCNAIKSNAASASVIK